MAIFQNGYENSHPEGESFGLRMESEEYRVVKKYIGSPYAILPFALIDH
jgi:hypothetical protein